MHYEERTRISTPEGLELELELAGIGSRAAAWLVDTTIQGIVLVLLSIGLAGSAEDSTSTGLAVVILLVASFVVIWGYYVLLETFRGGQTFGKELLGLRVLDREGGPVLFREAAVRNLLRPVDEWFTLFLGALLSIVRSRRNERIGDHAAGTIVVRDAKRSEGEAQKEMLFSERTWQLVSQASSWDTTQLTEQELSAARQYLARRHELPPERRSELAARLAAPLRAKIPGADPQLQPELFLEALVALRSTRG